MNQTKSNLVWVVVAVVVLGLLAWWYWGYQTAPQADVLSGSDITADIAKDFQTATIDGSVEQELDQLNQDINKL